MTGGREIYEIIVQAKGTQEVLAMERALNRLNKEAAETAIATKKMSGSLAALAKGGAIAAASIAAAFGVEAINRALDFADAIDETSRRIGITAEELQELQYAADQSGSSIESMDSALLRLSINMGKAAQGSGRFFDQLQTAGISLNNVNGEMKDVNEVIREYADYIQDLPSRQDQLNAATIAFGRAGADMVDLLDDGSEGLARFADEANRLGLVLNGEAAAAANELNDKLSTLARQTSVAVTPSLIKLVDVGLKLLDFFKELFSWAGKVLQPLKDFIQPLLDQRNAIYEIIFTWDKLVAWFDFKLPAMLSRALAQWYSFKAGIINALTPLAAQVAAIFDGVINAILGAIRLAYEKLSTFAGDAARTVANLPFGMGDSFSGELLEVSARLDGVGQSFRDIDTAATIAETGLEAATAASDAAGAAFERSAALTQNYEGALVAVDTRAVLASTALDELSTSAEGTEDALGGAAGGADGAASAIEETADQAEKAANVFDTFESNVTSAFDSMIDGTKGVEESFNDMLVGILSDIAKFMVSQQVTQFFKLLSTSYQGSWGGISWGTAPATASAATFGEGDGASSDSYVYGLTPSVTAYNGTSGSSSGDAMFKQEINIINQAGDTTEVQARPSPSGDSIDILITKKIKAAFASGSMDKTMTAAYGVRRRPA